MSIVGKIQRNLRLLIRPEKRYTFVLSTPAGTDIQVQVAHDLPEAIDLLSRRLNMTQSELLTVTTHVYEDGRRVWPAVLSSPAVSLEPLGVLFGLQNSLIEHKFPHEKAQIVDNRISDSGDIFREMTHRSPHFTYVMEKWTNLIAAVQKPPLSTLQAGDWDEIKENMQLPNYREQRDQFLANLRRLKDETLRTPMESKRRDLMVAALNLIEGLAFWFESMDPDNPPRVAMENLTGAVANYFPQFWEE